MIKRVWEILSPQQDLLVKDMFAIHTRYKVIFKKKGIGALLDQVDAVKGALEGR